MKSRFAKFVSIFLVIVLMAGTLPIRQGVFAAENETAAETEAKNDDGDSEKTPAAKPSPTAKPAKEEVKETPATSAETEAPKETTTAETSGKEDKAAESDKASEPTAETTEEKTTEPTEAAPSESEPAEEPSAPSTKTGKQPDESANSPRKNAKTVISSVAVTITAPKANASPAYSVTVPSGVGYYSKDEDDLENNVCHDVFWYDFSIGQALNPNSDKFQAGHQYEVTVYLTARYGYTFSKNLTATLNNNPASTSPVMYDASIHTEEEKVRVVYRFAKLSGDSNIITSVNVNLTAPAIGNLPDYDAVIASGAHYETADNTANLVRNGITWSLVYDDGGASYLNPDSDRFFRNEVYCVEIELTAKSGYCFDWNNLPTATVNGNPVDEYDTWDEPATYRTGNNLHIQYTFPKLQASANNYLSEAKVTVTPPVIGQKPKYTATYPSGANYYSDGSNVTWYDVTNNNVEVSSSSTFQTDHKYLVSVYVTPKSGYYFDSKTKATLNNNSAYTNYIDGKLRVYYTFAELKATPISAASVTVTAPKPGNSPVFTATTASGANYTVQSNSVKWYDASNNNAAVSSGTKFKGGHQYTVEVTLTANDGYCFNSSTTAKVNGNNANVADPGSQLKVTYTFSALDLVAISSTSVTVTAPKVGANPNYAVTPASGANYTVPSSTVKWYDASNSNAVLSSSDKFKGGHKYMVEMYLIADDGYKFTSSTTAQVNNVSATKTLEGTRLKVTYTFSALDLVTISSVSVKVTAPAKDATPSFTATPDSGANYSVTSGSVKWYDVTNSNAVMSSTGKFKAGHQYKVEVVLAANDGYGFAGSTTAKVNGNSATGALSNSQLKVTYTFGALDLVAISSVSVTVTAPAKDATPSFTATPGSGANYTVTSGSVKWYDVTNNNAVMTSTGKFKAGHQYKVEFVLAANDGYGFSGSTTAKVNGNSATAALSNSQLKVTYAFSALALETISSVAVSVTAPEAEKNPNYTATLAADANYTVQSGSVKWYDASNSNAVVSSSSKFKGGHKYMVEVYLTAKDGYCFASSVAAKVNSGTATATKVDDKLKITYTFSKLDLVTISSVSVKITAPAKDATPSFTATPDSGANFSVTSGSVKWYDVTNNNAVLSSTEKFKAGHQYKVEAVLVANDGYGFTGSPTAKVNGNSATAAVSNSQLKVTYTFSALDLVKISSVAITFDAPKNGGDPDYTASFASGVNYSYVERNSDNYSHGVKWWDVTDDAAVNSSNGKFKAGHQYMVEVLLTANEGYCFADGVSAKVNSNNATAVSDNGELIVTYTFKMIPLTAISSVSVTITAPERDKKPVYTATLESGANYYYQSSGITWKDVTNNNAVVSSSSTFQAGHQYKVEIYLTAREGYCFNGSTTAKVNDKTAVKAVEDGRLKVTYTFDEIPYPDVNAKIFCYNELTKEKITDGSVSVSKNGDTPIRTGDDPIVITVKSTEKFTLTAGVVSGGYTFTGWYSGEYGKQGATLISTDPTINVEITGDAWYYATFTKPLTEITKLTFTADKEPVVGKYPKDCLPTVSIAEDGITVTGRSWKDSKGNALSSTQTFTAGTTYRLYVTYSVKTGYKLADDIKDNTTLNGKKPAAHDTSKGTLSVSFTAGSFINVDGITVEGIVDKTYTGSEITQSPVVKRNGTALTEGRDYVVTYVDNINAGTATVVITGAGNYAGAKTVNFEILRAANTLAVKPKTAKVKYKKVKKKNQTLTIFKVLSFKSGGQGSKTYKKLSGNKKILINKTTGKVTVKKKLKKGTYKVKIKVMAAGNENYDASTWKTVTFRIRVK